MWPLCVAAQGNLRHARHEEGSKTRPEEGSKIAKVKAAWKTHSACSWGMKARSRLSPQCAGAVSDSASIGSWAAVLDEASRTGYMPAQALVWQISRGGFHGAAGTHG